MNQATLNALSRTAAIVGKHEAFAPHLHLGSSMYLA